MSFLDLRRSAVAAVVLAWAVLALAGCGGKGGPAKGTTITIKDFQFRPASLTVRPGAKVTVINQDSTAHTVTSSGAKKFDTGNIAGSHTTTFIAPTTPGSYPYICDLHEYMHGTLLVH